jgi:hypothetical protein
MRYEAAFLLAVFGIPLAIVRPFDEWTTFFLLGWLFPLLPERSSQPNNQKHSAHAVQGDADPVPVEVRRLGLVLDVDNAHAEHVAQDSKVDGQQNSVREHLKHGVSFP